MCACHQNCEPTTEDIVYKVNKIFNLKNTSTTIIYDYLTKPTKKKFVYVQHD